MINKDLRIRIDEIRRGITIITKATNLLYTEISELIEEKEVN